MCTNSLKFWPDVPNDSLPHRGGPSLRQNPAPELRLGIRASSYGGLTPQLCQGKGQALGQLGKTAKQWNIPIININKYYYIAGRRNRGKCEAPPKPRHHQSPSASQKREK